MAGPPFGFPAFCMLLSLAGCFSARQAPSPAVAVRQLASGITWALNAHFSRALRNLGLLTLRSRGVCALRTFRAHKVS